MAADRRRIPKAQNIVRHDKIDYLKLRRTKQSLKAIERNNGTMAADVQIDNMPAMQLPEHQKMSRTKRRFLQIQALERDQVQETQLNKFRKIKEIKKIEYVPSSYEIEQIEPHEQRRQLIKRRERAEKAEKKERKKVLDTIQDIRDSISSMYVFTPSFRIYSRYKLKSALELWRFCIENGSDSSNY